MSWVRLDDKAMSHPKIVGLSDKAFRLWVWGLAYCQQHLTDGVVVAVALTVQQIRTALELVTARLWEPTDTGWRVHHYTDWNDSREEVEEKRARSRERMRGVRANFARRTSHEVPVRLGSGSSSESIASSKKKEEPENPLDPLRANFDRFWAIYPNKKGKNDALSAWRKCHPSDTLTDLIIAAVERQKIWPTWTKDGGQFIPHPATWLNRGCWDDEPTAAAVSRVSDVGRQNAANAEEALRIMEERDAPHR